MDNSRLPLALLIAAILTTPVTGQEPPADDSAAAERVLETARLTLRLYRKVEFPLRIRQLESQIALAEAELGSFRRRIAEYEAFSRNKYSAPLFFSLEQARLAETATRLRLEGLREELLLVERYYRDRCRLLELEVEAAQSLLQRLAAPAGSRKRIY